MNGLGHEACSQTWPSHFAFISCTWWKECIIVHKIFLVYWNGEAPEYEYIYIYIYIYIFRPIYTLGRDITCLLLAGLRGVKLWHFIKQCEIEEEIWCVVNNTTCCNRTNSVELILEEQRILSTINHLTYWNVTLHLPL